MFRYLFSLLLLLVSASAFAQLGEVRGVVTDKETGEEMPFANIKLNQDGVLVKGAVTDLEGLYRINDLKPGVYQVEVSYIGYDKATKEVTIKPDEITFLNFKLVSSYVDDLPPARFYYRRYMKPLQVDPKSAITHTDLDDTTIQQSNFGQDFPYLLATTPSTVTYSDAGAGVGYTGVRIRGVDPTRVNVTINGIPLNDGESQGVFWVDLPDFATSANNVQIQRGVGTSTNGSGAFGASINIGTKTYTPQSSFILTSTVGSYNTYRNNLNVNTGLLNNGWVFDLRASKITSDGYIDRGSSDLRSGYFAASRYGKLSLFQAIMMTGHEETYQAWYGVPQDSLETNRTYNEKSYENEVDNYQQDHYMALYEHSLTTDSKVRVRGGLHYTKGRGYYEQYREQDDMSTYGINPFVLYIDDSTNVTVTTTDLIRRRWLDNDFYGAIASFSYSNKNQSVPREFHFGGGYHIYEGNHFGEVIWAQYANNTDIRDKYYDDDAEKTDFNVYAKTNYSINHKWMLFGDVQARSIDYNFYGLQEDLTYAQQNIDFMFLNPKAGVVHTINNYSYAFASYSQANREPVRSDLVDLRPSERATSEKLHDIEIGYRRQTEKYIFEATLYNMQYKDQLVPTGGLNDVGAIVRVNVPNSFRRGIELAGSTNINKWIKWTGNFTYSQNQIERYAEIVNEWEPPYGSDTSIYENVNIALSPDIIASSMFRFVLPKNITADVITKYVSDQYLDNTGNESRKLDAYLVNNIRLRYEFGKVSNIFKKGSIGLLANNVLNELYSSNGYTYSGIFDGGDGRQRYDYNYYYPQAERNYMLQVKLEF